MPQNSALERAPELTNALAIAGRPSSAPRMPPASPRVRLKTSPWLRRLLPTRLVVDRAIRRGQALWEQSPKARSGAEAAVDVIVAGTPRARERTELARAHLLESEADRALFWQPWPTARIDDEANARVRDVVGARRGVLLSACHFGPYYRTMSVFAARGRRPYAVAGPWFFEKPTPDYWGRRLARWRRGSCARLILSRGSFSIVRALLERSELVLVYFDMPGPHETRFLGKPAMLADGSARLALEADALILPLRARRVGHRAWVDVAEPLDPRDFEGVDELHDALAALHESWILELPAAMADPRSFGWAHGATPQAWTPPSSIDDAD
jgi:lauroyl/myristoyl acyltransferase